MFNRIKGLYIISMDTDSLQYNFIRLLTSVQELPSDMAEYILSQPHDESGLDENPDGYGRFGLDVSNPIPIHGIDNIKAYMDRLRYSPEPASKEERIFYPVTYQRTTDRLDSPIGSKLSGGRITMGATSSPNIRGKIDVFDVYSIKGRNLARLFVNCYSLVTSNKVPEGFFHRDDIAPSSDYKVIEYLKKGRSQNTRR